MYTWPLSLTFYKSIFSDFANKGKQPKRATKPSVVELMEKNSIEIQSYVRKNWNLNK